MNKVIGLLVGGALAMAISAFAADAPSMTPAPAPAPEQMVTTHTPPAVHASAQHDSTSKSKVKEIQQALNASGEKVPVDGVYGAKTRHAMKEFQKKHGLKVTGHPDPATLEQLKIS